jgi:hypothetical protein
MNESINDGGGGGGEEVKVVMEVVVVVVKRCRYDGGGGGGHDRPVTLALLREAAHMRLQANALVVTFQRETFTACSHVHDAAPSCAKPLCIRA